MKPLYVEYLAERILDDAPTKTMRQDVSEALKKLAQMLRDAEKCSDEIPPEPW